MKLHKHFTLIVLWAMGFTIQEKCTWSEYWEDANAWVPAWNDPDFEFRLKNPDELNAENIIIAMMFIGFIIFLLIGVSYV